MVSKSANIKIDRYLNGYVDDTGIYDRVLSLRDVDVLFNEPNPVITVGIETINVASDNISVYPNTAQTFLRPEGSLNGDQLSLIEIQR